MNFIVSVDQNWGIGREGDLLFHVSEDMKYFRETTVGKVVVMGDVTLKSLPGGNPLKNRTNIVLSNDPDFTAEGVVICRSMDELFDTLKQFPPDDVFVIGGASIYNQLMDYCAYAYITKFERDGKADKFINRLDGRDGWELEKTSERYEHEGLFFTFHVYKNSDVNRYQPTKQS